MKRHLYKKVILIVIASIILILFYHFVLSFKKAFDNNDASKPLSIPEERQYWGKQIDQIGPEKAYAEIKNKYDGDITNSHGMMHLFGELLYDKLGTEGITVCDSYAGFGCFHGFFNKSVLSGGINATVSMAEECSKKYSYGSGCHHGIGHIVLNLKNYDINAALDFCKKLSGFSPEDNGCVGGVLMEYNQRTLREEDQSIKSRPWNESKPYSPCFEIEKMFRSACAHEQPDWWKTAYNFDFPKMGKLCFGFGSSLRYSCLKGIGRTASEKSEYDLEKTIAICNSLPNLESTDMCKLGAAWTYKYVPEFSSLASKVCDVGAKLKDECP